MADIEMRAMVSRGLLGLAPLDINDMTVYRAGLQFLGGQVSWNRKQIESPYMDGATTVSRARQMVQETVTVDVMGRTKTDFALTNAQLKANFDVLADALIQDNFTLTVTIDGAVYKYQCESADYQTIWMGTRFMAKRGQMIFQVPRQPVALLGTV